MYLYPSKTRADNVRLRKVRTKVEEAEPPVGLLALYPVASSSAIVAAAAAAALGVGKPVMAPSRSVSNPLVDAHGIDDPHGFQRSDSSGSLDGDGEKIPKPKQPSAKTTSSKNKGAALVKVAAGAKAAVEKSAADAKAHYLAAQEKATKLAAEKKAAAFAATALVAERKRLAAQQEE